MKAIPLTQGLVTLVDDEDYDRLVAFKWHATRKHGGVKWYATRNVPLPSGGQTKVRMHRVLLNVSHDAQVDHIDGNSLNNQKNNLRIVTNQQNQWNRGLNRNASLPFKGVTRALRTRSLWFSRITINGKPVHVGTFTSPEAAARAYDERAKLEFGEYAYLNFPSIPKGSDPNLCLEKNRL